VGSQRVLRSAAMSRVPHALREARRRASVRREMQLQHDFRHGANAQHTAVQAPLTSAKQRAIRQALRTRTAKFAVPQREHGSDFAAPACADPTTRRHGTHD